MGVGVLLVFSSCLVGLADEPAPSPRSAYREAAARAGRDPDAHARLALWCEARGLDAERVKHLGMAVVTDPTHALARGLLGLVQDGGKWRRPEQVVERNAADPARAALRAEYHAKRSAAGEAADGQAKLGAWCESKGLVAESRAHYAMALRRDPRREDLWKKLGYRKHEGQWRTDAQVAAAKAEARAQEEADRRWAKQLGAWKAMLGQAENRRKEAVAGLLTVDDPRAVPAVLKAFAKDDPALAVRLLGQIDAAGASQALATAAVFASSEAIRRAAAETLTQRDPREYAGVLIPLIRDPIRYEVKPVGGPGSPGELWVEGKKADLKRLYAPPPPPQVGLLPGDMMGYDAYGLPTIRRISWAEQSSAMWHTITIDRTGPARANAFLGALAQDPNIGPAAAGALGSWYASIPESLPFGLSPRSGPSFGDLAPGFVPFGAPRPVGLNSLGFTRLPSQPGQTTETGLLYGRQVWVTQQDIHVGQAMAAARQTAATAQQRLQADVAQLESYNRAVGGLNDRIVPLLAQASGRDFGPKREAWDDWLTDQVGYATFRNPQYKPTIVQNVPLAGPAPLPVSTTVGVYFRGSCFAAGTPVWTQDGLRPIEALEVGDLVLSQDTATGVQSYQPVLVVHRNPPSATLKVAFEGGDAVTASTYHRFWRAGRGWAMARELEAGDVLRTQSGLAVVSGIVEEKVQPVYNLDVAASHSFFVGVNGALVHDNSLPDTRAGAFDRVPEIAADAP
jgi:hypothetical protein